MADEQDLSRPYIGYRRPRASALRYDPAEVEKAARETLSKFTSLDEPKDMTLGETAVDIAAGFVPGLGTAQAARDFERARREGDKLGMGLAGAGMIPVVGGMVKSGKAAAKSLGELVDQYVRKVRKMDELGPATLSVHRVEAPASAEVPGWHITQDLPGILETGAMTNKGVGDRNLQGWAPAHVGGAYFYSDPRLARAKWEDVAEMLAGDRALAAEMPVIRAQLRRGNRLVPDEDVSLNVPWQQSYQEGSFATTRPVLINQIDRIYSADPDITKDVIRDTVVRQRRYADGGLADLNAKYERGGRVRPGEGLPDPSLLNFQLYADTVSREMFPDERQNPQRDAARHLLASALAAQKTTPGIAEFLGKAHEFKEAPLRTAGHWLGLTEPRADYPTDIHNNALGVQLGRDKRSLRELLDSVEAAVRSGTPTRQPGRVSLEPDADTRYAEGGEVVGEDQDGVNRMVALEQGGMAYAEGGLVAYDPEEINTLASQVREEFHG